MASPHNGVSFPSKKICLSHNEKQLQSYFSLQLLVHNGFIILSFRLASTSRSLIIRERLGFGSVSLYKNRSAETIPALVGEGIGKGPRGRIFKVRYSREKRERYVDRLSPDEIFSGQKVKAQRNIRINIAHIRHGYTLKEIADSLQIH